MFYSGIPAVYGGEDVKSPRTSLRKKPTGKEKHIHPITEEESLAIVAKYAKLLKDKYNWVSPFSKE